MKRKLMIEQDQVAINNSTDTTNSRLIFSTAEDVVEHISEFLGVKK